MDALFFTGAGQLPSVFPVTDLASASMAVAGLALAEVAAPSRGPVPQVRVDRRLASFWFGGSLRPIGWALAPLWDTVAGDYQAADGWIRLHTNAPHHRAAALAVLGGVTDRKSAAQAVAGWRASDLESAVVEQGGCAAAMRSLDEWSSHPQGRAVQAEPLLHMAFGVEGPERAWVGTAQRPLHGVRVLDLTRILAGPVATRFLAGFGAEVLRIDPPGWEEPGTVPEVVLSKRCARLDLRQAADRAVFEHLLRQADVLVHGLRPEALERLGLGVSWRRAVHPGLIDVSLDAYGWSGPWRGRQGFDSLIQMSTGIAEAGMRRTGRQVPVPLPVQAIDHATGYLMAAAALKALAHRQQTGRGCEVRASLARTAHWLAQAPSSLDREPLLPEFLQDQSPEIEATAWGPARRLLAPLSIEGMPMRWELPAPALGSSAAAWSGT
ncbi:CoA transferase [Acidovorax sp. GBBC 1281]|uniref:CoA transferase n=1 Tax=Acidovorax sp. SUPP2522 TaxID=511900 RepID=UPI002349D422|nr:MULTISPECIES: CoA transferase [unclassified Acidovorax]WCN00372.1 CoA transferase [Acidovorax sp. GBBC 1281]